jgi:hypothetical protein
MEQTDLKKEIKIINLCKKGEQEIDIMKETITEERA